MIVPHQTDAFAGNVTAVSGFIGHFIGRSVILNHPRHPNCFPFIHFVPISGAPPLRWPVSLVIPSPLVTSLPFSSLPGLAGGDDKGGSSPAAGVPLVIGPRQTLSRTRGGRTWRVTPEPGLILKRCKARGREGKKRKGRRKRGKLGRKEKGEWRDSGM